MRFSGKEKALGEDFEDGVMTGSRSLSCPSITQFLVKGKRPLHHDLGNLIMLDAFDLGGLGELGASLFPGPKGGSRKGRKGRKG